MLPSLASFRVSAQKPLSKSARVITKPRPSRPSLLPKYSSTTFSPLASSSRLSEIQPFTSYGLAARSLASSSRPHSRHQSASRQYSSRSAPTPEALQQAARKTADLLKEVWTEWEMTTDVFEKRERGKYALELYAQFSKNITALAKDQTDFEHLALIHGHPISLNSYRMGVLHAQRLEYEQAVEHLQRAVELSPANYDYSLAYGEVLHTSRMYGTAVSVYTNVLNTMNAEFKKSPERPQEVPVPEALKTSVFKVLNLSARTTYPHSKLAEALFRRANTQLMMHHFEEALGDWKSVVGLEANHRTAESWAYLAHLSRIHGKWQQTVDLSTKALQFDPQLLLALYERSMAHFVMNNEEGMKHDNRAYAILAHEKMWGISTHPIPADWGQEDKDDSYEDEL